MGEFIQGSEGDFFVQTDRSSPFDHLTCVGVGDLPLPQGDLTPVYCPDDESKGKFKVEGFIRGEPGAGTTSLSRPLFTTANWLLEQKCDFVSLITYACRGARAIPSNYQIAVVLFGAQITSSTLASAVAKGPDEEGRIDTTADISYSDRRLIYHITASEQALTNTADAAGIVFLPEACESKCGPARGLCEQGFMAMGGILYDSEIKKTLSSGATWEQCATDPFTEGGDTSDVVVFETYDDHRAVVSRGSSTAHLPAEVSWTEDWGATWNDIDVGATLGQTIQKLHRYGGWLWAVASGGDIYRSKTLSATWEAVEEHVETLEDLNDFVAYTKEIQYAVGDNNAFLYTIDGEDFNAKTGPAPLTNLLSVTCNDKGHVFVGAADGNLYVSEDEGDTWSTRVTFGAGSVDWVRFDRSCRYFGGLIHNTAVGVGTFYRSIDGGATWDAPAGQSGAWNSGLNTGFICDQNHYFAVGDTHDGNTFVTKFVPA